MTSNLRRTSSAQQRRRHPPLLLSSSPLPRRRNASPRVFALVASGALVLTLASACRSSSVQDNETARGIVIVNAPASGEVRRVLVREGMQVGEGSPVVEIAVATEAPAAPQPQTEDPQARAGRNIAASQAEVDAARAEVVRQEVEVQRLTPLVASGEAPQGQLDGARALYEQAQQRLQRAMSAAQNAQAGLVAARQPTRNANAAAATAAAPSERLVNALATSAGTVTAINARVGERVVAGQPLATLRQD